MDDVDREIIDLLRENARLSNVDIAEEIDVSEGTVRNRINKLEENEVIERYTIEISEEAQFHAYVLCKTDPSILTENIVEKMSVDSIHHVHELAGEWDMLLDVVAENASAFNRVVENVRTTPGIRTTQTMTVLNTH